MVRKILIVSAMFLTSIWIGTTLIPEQVVAQTLLRKMLRLMEHKMRK